MKATLSFNLPEETPEFRTAIDGWKWRSILRQLDEDLRAKIKWENTLDEFENKALQSVRDKIRELVTDNNLELDE